jgi:hypothetical protein
MTNSPAASGARPVFLFRRKGTIAAALAASLAAAVAVAQAPPKAKATLSRTSVPAAGRQEAIVKVSAFGYYALTVASSQGTSLQLVDRMAGPGLQSGEAGTKDGRLDLFLDRGEYKLIALGHEKASGNARLEVNPYTELHAPQPPLLVELKPIDETLQDFQQASYWLQVDEARVVAIEAAGRNLADLRLWRDGTWLHEAVPEREPIEPKKGHPMRVCRLSTHLEAGLYLVTAYGGPGQPWSEDASEHPLYVRFGIPRLPQAGRQRLTVGPLGYDRFLAPGDTTYFRVELPEARPAQLQVGQADPDRPLHNEGSVAEITKKSLPPAAEAEIGKTPDHDRVVTVRAEAGQPYILQQFEASRTYEFRKTGDHWISTVHSGHPEDSVDATVIVARWSDRIKDREAFLDQAVEVDGTHGWARRCNLLDTMTIFLKVGAKGRYEVLSRGVEATFRIEPFFTWRPEHYESPKAKPSGSAWDLDAGFYVLGVFPDTKGILDIVVRPYGVLTYALEKLGKEAGTQQTPLRAAALFPRVTLNTDDYYMAYLNDQPGVRAGVVLRPLPLDLTEALPVTQRPGEDLKTTFKADERGTLRARDEAGTLIDVSVDGGAPRKETVVEEGEHTLSVSNAGAATVLYSLALEPVRLQAAAPLPPVPPEALEALPKFPTLTAGAPTFLDMESSESATFLVRADAPALYRLESTGLLATEGNVRTRTVLSLDRQAANGVGRNFLIQQYLREGEYQLTVQPEGASAGHLGVKLEKTLITDGGLLAPSVPARISLPAGQGVAYRFTIESRGEYHLRTLGLGHDFRCRLEDADGWPIEHPNIRADITRTFEPGGYRLVLLPEDVMTRRVTVLEKAPEPLHFAGHGPHQLPLDRQVDHVWEQASDGGRQTPDVWEFSLPATARTQVDLSAVMNGELELVGGEGAGKVGDLTLGKGWSGELKAGSYRLSVVCARNNNQVGYRLAVKPGPLVAGLTREISAPDSIGLAVGRAGLVELSSFGSDDVRAVLLSPKGRVLASNDDRPDDWNFHIATSLEPGNYTLRVIPVGAGRATCAVSMRTPGEAAEPPLAVPGRREIETGQAAHVVPLQLPGGAELLVASVRSAESVGCVLEAQSEKGWRPLATRVGRDLRLEVPLRGPELANGSTALRMRVWSVDQRGLPARLVVAAVAPGTVSEAALGSGIDLGPVAGSDPPVGAALVHLERPGMFLLSAAEVRATSRTARAAESSAGEPVAAAGSSLWLVSDITPGARASVRGSRMVVEAGGSVALRVPPGEPVVCDLGGGETRTVLAVASSMSGQPGARIVDRAHPSDAGAGPVAMAVGRHGAVAVAVGVRQVAAAVWQAEPSVEPIEVRLQQFSYPARQPEPAPFGTLSGSVAGRNGVAYDLPPGPKRLQLGLGEGIVAVLSSDKGIESVHWAGGPAFAESLDTSATKMVLLRAGSDRGSFSINVLPPLQADSALTLGTERPFESVEAAAGILRLTVPKLDVTADHPYTVHIRGTSEAVFLGADGRVRHGREMTVGSSGGSLLLSHGPGRLLCWLDRAGDLAEALWGLVGNLTATTIDPPATLALHGKAMMVRVNLGHPALLHLRTATPVATRLVRPGGEPEIALHPNGCSLDAYLPSGTAELGLRAVSGLELAGSAELTATGLTSIDEGLGPELLLPPGETRAFSFTVTLEGPVGVGVRADSDTVTCKLLDSAGRPLGSGVVLMTKLTPGEYVLTVHAPARSAPARVRPAVVGIRPPDTGPPPEVIRKYLELATGKSEASAATAARGQTPSEQEETEEAQPGESEEPGEGEEAPEPPGGAR